MHDAARDPAASGELGPADFQQIRIIHAALMAGATMFLIVTLVLGFTASGGGGGAPVPSGGAAAPSGGPAAPVGPATAAPVLEMPALLACIAVGVMLACLVARVLVTRAAVADRSRGGDDVAAYSSVAIIRAALLEGPALLGVVALLLAGLDGGLGGARPLVWVGLVPYVAMIGLMIVDWPGPAAMRRILGGGSGDAAWKAER